jgi:hypothetical protein
VLAQSFPKAAALAAPALRQRSKGYDGSFHASRAWLIMSSGGFRLGNPHKPEIGRRNREVAPDALKTLCSGETCCQNAQYRAAYA